MELLDVVLSYAREFWILFGPGGKTHPGYFLEHKGHLVIEGLLCAFIVYLFFLHSSKPRRHAEGPLTDKASSSSSSRISHRQCFHLDDVGFRSLISDLFRARRRSIPCAANGNLTRWCPTSRKRTCRKKES